MDPVSVLIIILVLLIGLIVLGLHIGMVLGSVSLLGTYLLFGNLPIALDLAAQSAYAVLRNAIGPDESVVCLTGMPLMRKRATCFWTTSLARPMSSARRVWI